MSIPYPNGSVNRPNRNSFGFTTTASYNTSGTTLGQGQLAQIFNLRHCVHRRADMLGQYQRNYRQLRRPGHLQRKPNVRKHFYFGERFKGILQVDYFNSLTARSSNALTRTPAILPTVR